TATALAIDHDQAKDLLTIGRHQALRINTLKSDEHTLEELTDLGWQGSQFAWYEHGYSIDKGLEAVRDSRLVQDGKVYIQNPASWLPVILLNPQPNETILDVCSAPGGKTSHIAQATNNQAEITANDNSHHRLIKLKTNLGRLGVTSVDFTLFDAQYLTKKLGNISFDKILLDAPCSGEGMMQLDNDKDLAYWSVAQIKRLQILQRKLMNQAWQLLKPGGTLVYSTCTIAPEENEANIDHFLKRHEDAQLIDHGFTNILPNITSPVLNWNNKQYSPILAKTLRLKPSRQIEAFFVAKIAKSSNPAQSAYSGIGYPAISKL
ncbi:RsmB/NOP family class I SAM-dependent RNA methyltransferase, partial [Candidatus Saccharibacteria bacterium]|nr:RsmB/NOP family class I SAM-dependent RNA methyltransferase [Candidatus Saccharibacteria bacterium]